MNLYSFILNNTKFQKILNKMSMGAYVHYVRQRFPDGGAGGGGVDVSQTAENGHLQYISYS